MNSINHLKKHQCKEISNAKSREYEIYIYLLNNEKTMILI
jgi:hypothetical protein